MIYENEKGFTILELMIATTIFTFILLLCTFGLIQIGKIYYKGITASRTQSVARSISDDVSQAIQYSGMDVEPTSPSLSINGGGEDVDVGNRKYNYVLGRLLVDGATSTGQANSVLRATTIGADGQAVAGQTPRELLNSRMWLSRFDVSLTNGIYRVSVQVVSGDQDLVEDKNGKAYTDPNFDRDSLRCKADTGSQFCAVSGLYTDVVKRL